MIQVSDRRLTNGRSGDVVDDQYTKLVCWNFNFSIGFTGLARIDRAQRKSTSHWIAETICDYGLFEHGVQALASAASERIRKLPTAWPDRRLGIVVAGFDGREEPLVAEIANFEAGGPMPSDPTKFDIRVLSRAPNAPLAYRVTGAQFTEKWQHQLLMQRVSKALAKKTPEDITYGVKLMVSVKRSVAKTNKTVGTDAMVVTIPRTTFGEQFLLHLHGGRMLSNLDGTNTIGGSSGPEFAYFDTAGYKFRQLGPLNASGGFAMGDLEATADPDNPDNQTVSFRILKTPRPPTQAASGG